MTDKEQIICKYKFQDKEKFDGKPYCTCFNELCKNLSFVCDQNCIIYEDYKQLVRKTQECEELKERLERTEEDLKYQCVDCMNVKSDRYRKALEEIEKVINNILNSCLGRNTVSCRPAHNVCGDLINILDIINKAKGAVMNEFYRETNINKTRKEHCCECCGGKIEVGSKCVNMAGKTDEDYFFNLYAHKQCIEIYKEEQDNAVDMLAFCETYENSIDWKYYAESKKERYLKLLKQIKNPSNSITWAIEILEGRYE